jgi:multisubunit Na+/H+ antiporter MnhB subunit
MIKDEYGKDLVKRIFAFLWVGVGIILVITGHKDIGVQGLMIQMLGLSMLLLALYVYNKPHSK